MLITTDLRNQKGVGMMEVLVSIMILSVAILGFVALQVRATVATEEAIKRSDSLIILNGLAEKMRLNPTNAYKNTIPTSEPACVASQDCDATNQALADLYQYSQLSATKNIALGIIDCPNTSSNQTRLCIVAGWNDTQPVLAASGSTGGCLSSNGRYVDDSDCLVLEAY